MIALNLFGFDPFSNSLSFFDLICFGVGSFVVISILSWYYNRISKSSHLINHVEIYIYQSRDSLLQEYKVQGEYVPTRKSTSVWVKTIVYILILLVVTTPLFELFGMQTIH